MDEGDAPAQSALVVLVPDAEPFVSAWRTELDPSAAWGVPAHITLLHPFMPPSMIDDEVVRAVGAVIARFPRVHFLLDDVRWFGSSVAWLSPEPSSIFADMTLALLDAFPGQPRYGGSFGDQVVPHLTIADGAPPDRMERAARDVARNLPIEAQIADVALIVGSPRPSSWRVERRFALT